MSSSVEIIVRKQVLLANALQMKKIANSISNKRIDRKCSGSKGDTIDSLNSIVDQLNAVGQDLGKLMLENAVLVENIAIKFGKTDKSIASDLSDG
ncbi:MAG: hypothetical protein E7517_00115 [Ruminococcaceae bacterium]|nr:hypothetical protein [Oscillospiraceae bacterium]